MARIRSIKPEFWSSEQVMDCSTTTRLLFIGMWNFCDDAGRLPNKPRQIKASVFPGDDISATDIHGMIQELSRNGLIKLYTVEEQSYLSVTGWGHQRIDKPQKPKYPDPREDCSETIPGLFPPDRIGKDRIGKDRIGKKASSARENSTNGLEPDPKPNPDPPPAVAEVDWKLMNIVRERVCELAGADDTKSPVWAQVAWAKYWLVDIGADPEADIYPAVEAVMAKRTKPPGVPAYFLPAIQERLEKHQAESAKERATLAMFDGGRRQTVARLRDFVDKGFRRPHWDDVPEDTAEARALLARLTEGDVEADAAEERR